MENERDKPSIKERVVAQQSKSAGRPVVFLDRDGTLNMEVSYIRQMSQLVLLPSAIQAVRALNQADIAAVVVTNQSGVARGFYPESHVQAVNKHLVDMLAEGGANLDGVYYCPHHKEGRVPEYAIACSCRKPSTGLLERAFKELKDIDKSNAYMVGDQSTDIDLARNAGIKAVLVNTGFGKSVMAGEFQWKVEPDFVADTVLHAVRWILEDLATKDAQT